MLRRTLLAGLLLAPMILTACEDKDASGPQGTNGVVTVNAYVDADGSGTPNAGDTFLSGRSVTLTGNDGQAFTATTDATGKATFDAVPPGSYTVSATGTVPTGAVLATASSPVVVVPFQGGTMSTEFRYVFNPGSISGQLFRDNNANGTFDTGDTPAPGQTVSLYSGTDTTKAPVQTVVTDANGVFTFNTVRPGAYTTKVTAIPTITIVGGTTQAVTVGANAATTLPVKFTGNLIGTIAEARAAAVGATVAFEGIATVGQNTFASPVSGGTTSQQIYVQDATGGILVFNIGTAPGIAAGDSVRVIGTRGVNATEVQVTTPTVTKLATKTVPAARVITEAQAVALQFQGQLVTIPNLLVRNIGAVSATTGSYNVGVGGPLPADTFTIRVPSSNTGIPASTWVVGQRYDVTGDLGVFNNIANLKPRSPADVKVRSNAISIAAARLRPDNDTVTVEGVIYLGTDVLTASTSTNRNAYIVDNSGAGALVFGVPAGTTLVNGDSVRITALTAHFPANANGEFELSRFAASPLVIEKLGTVTPRQPVIITAAQLASRKFDGSLVKIMGATITSVPTTGTAFNVTAVGADGTQFTIRVGNANTGVTLSNFTVGQRVDVSGAALNFFTAATSTFTPQVLVRSPADITASTTAGVRTIASIRSGIPAGAAGVIDSATVEGVVTAGRLTFNAASIYIDDGTDGIQVFNVPTTLNLVPGDYVRVHGKVVKFGATNQELEFTNAVPTGDVFSVTKIGQGPVIAPIDLTGAQLVARVAESRLVRLQNVTVTAVSTPTAAGGSYTVNGTAADGTAVIIFMAAPNSPAGNVTPPSIFTVGTHYDITGVEIPFTPTGTTTPVGELKPRGAFDVVAR